MGSTQYSGGIAATRFAHGSIAPSVALLAPRLNLHFMPYRRSCAAVLFVVAMTMVSPLRADVLSDIETLHRAGDLERALQEANDAIAAQPRAAQIRFLKGLILTDLNRVSEAKEVFTALTQDFPELPDPYNNLAVLLAAQGQLQEALAALQAALRNDPTHRAARENLGDVHLALAIAAWSAAPSGDAKTDAGLQRKLQLARQIQARPG